MGGCLASWCDQCPWCWNLRWWSGSLLAILSAPASHSWTIVFWQHFLHLRVTDNQVFWQHFQHGQLIDKLDFWHAFCTCKPLITYSLLAKWFPCKAVVFGSAFCMHKPLFWAMLSATVYICDTNQTWNRNHRFEVILTPSLVSDMSCHPSAMTLTKLTLPAFRFP